MRAKEGADPFSDSSLSLPPTLLLDKFIVLLTPEPSCVFTLGEGVYVCVCVCVYLRGISNAICWLAGWKNFKLEGRFSSWTETFRKGS